MATYRIIFEDAGWRNLLPLVYWRSVAELRCGCRLLGQKHFEPGQTPDLWVREELADTLTQRNPDVQANKPAPPDLGPDDRVLLINARWLADKTASGDGPPAIGVCRNQIAYLRLTGEQAAKLSPQAMLSPSATRAADWAAELGRAEQAGGHMIRYPWDLVHHNPAQLLADWKTIGDGGIAGKIHDGVYMLNEKDIHIGEGSVVMPCTVLNAEDGPIYIEDGVTISTHCSIQGPVCIGHNTLIQNGAVIREGTTIGPVCKVGGEVEESVIWGYSNKQHDGFLGHAVLGAWINIAADSINSDLKNTYGTVNVPINGVEIDSGEQFVGLTMGDHSKSSINASFPTGAVVGFCANVVCNAFPPKFVPSFCWLTDECSKPYDVEKGLQVARAVMARRKVELTPAEEQLFRRIAHRCREIEVSGQLEMPES